MALVPQAEQAQEPLPPQEGLLGHLLQALPLRGGWPQLAPQLLEGRGQRPRAPLPVMLLAQPPVLPPPLLPALPPA